MVASVCAWILLMHSSIWAEKAEPVREGTGKSGHATPAIETNPKHVRKVRELIPKLGDPSYKVREAAMKALYRLDESAIQPLQDVQNHKNLELRWRARKLLTCIKWQITPEDLERLGAVMEGFEEKGWQDRERICQELGLAGKEKVIPTLLEIVKRDKSPAVKRSAIATLYRMGDVGIAALVDQGIKIDGLEPFYLDLFISLGNRYLTEGNYEKAKVEYFKVLKADPSNSIAAYNLACMHSLKEEIAESLEWLKKSVEFGFEDFKWMKDDPDLKNLHGNPEYEELLRTRGRNIKPKQEEP